jgi:hypothetical protein
MSSTIGHYAFFSLDYDDGGPGGFSREHGDDGPICFSLFCGLYVESCTSRCKNHVIMDVVA